MRTYLSKMLANGNQSWLSGLVKLFDRSVSSSPSSPKRTFREDEDDRGRLLRTACRRNLLIIQKHNIPTASMPTMTSKNAHIGIETIVHPSLSDESLRRLLRGSHPKM
jgi:hypothetical protein